MEIFHWSPRLNASGDIKLKTLGVQFGDGYRQDAADGINNKGAEWHLTFVNKESMLQPIKDFLDAHGGWKSFLWAAPMSQLEEYKAGQYNLVALGAKGFSLSVTFVRSSGVNQ